MKRVFDSCEATRGEGQKEYAGGEDAFGNFNRLATRLDLDRNKVLWTYLEKHLDGIISYINGHKSQRESVHGRIKDAIVYLILLDGMISESDPERSESNVKQTVEKLDEKFQSTKLSKELRNLVDWNLYADRTEMDKALSASLKLAEEKSKVFDIPIGKPSFPDELSSLYKTAAAPISIARYQAQRKLVIVADTRDQLERRSQYIDKVILSLSDIK